MERSTKPSILKKILYKINPSQHYKKDSYSQAGEDLLIKNCLEIFKINNPSYIDVGANHPFHFNNTALFYKHGCRGINIEPNPTLLNLMIKHRSEDINLNIGVSDVSGELNYYEFEPSTLNTCSESEALNYESLGYKIKSRRKIEVDTLQNIIKKYYFNIFPDILSLDVEGLDEKILKSIDFSTNYPKIICVETIKFDIKIDVKNKCQSILNLLMDNGYQVYADTFINTILFKK